MRSIIHQTTKNEEHTKKKFLGRVLGPDGRTPNLTTSHITHSHLTTSHIIQISPHHTSQAERREHKEEVLGPSSWAGWLTTPHLTDHTSEAERRKHKEEALGPSSWAGWLTTPHHTSHIHISPHHTTQAGRREHKEEVLGPSSYPGWHSHHITHHTSFTSHHITHHTFTSHHITHRTSFTSHHITHLSFTSHHITHHKPKVRKSTSFIVKTPLRTIPDQRKVRELQPKMNIQEVEEPKGRKSTSFIVKTSLRSIRDQRKVRELPRKMNIEEVEEPETTKIYTQNRGPTTAPPPKLRKFTHTKRTCKHESTKIATNSVRHLDLATRPFTTTVRTPRVKHTVWGKKRNNAPIWGEPCAVSGFGAAVRRGPGAIACVEQDHGHI